jgi:hypothetical protein
MKSGKAYKVGRSNSAGRREYELGIQLPDKLTTVHVIRTDDPPGIETYWHNRFAAKRKNGEWFDLDAADITAFKRRKFHVTKSRAPSVKSGNWMPASGICSPPED